MALTPAWPTPEQGAPEQSLAHAVPNQTSVLDVCFRPDRNAKQDPNTDTRRGGDSCRPVSWRGSASPRSCLGTRGASTVGGEPQEGAACGQVRGVLAHTLAGAAVAGAGGAQPGRGEGGFHSEANANEASRILSLDDCPAVGWPGGRDRACARCVRASDVAPRSHAGPAALPAAAAALGPEVVLQVSRDVTRLYLLRLCLQAGCARWPVNAAAPHTCSRDPAAARRHPRWPRGQGQVPAKPTATRTPCLSPPRAPHTLLGPGSEFTSWGTVSLDRNGTKSRPTLAHVVLDRSAGC